ncbi:MAG: 5-(carboxyamino)imidazole ribonucleotide mutase [Nitrospira sp.]|nr:5-(carboxyamino)imidazole ribonucleotide mutase [Nitrospira sp.]
MSAAGQKSKQSHKKRGRGIQKGQPIVGVLGGSKSDFPILEKTGAILAELHIPYELLVVSAHRTPDRLFEYATTAPGRGIEVIVAGAGGAAHLPGMLAAKTHLPVIGVPIPTENLRGLDSLLSIVQMPKGIPVATVAIGGGENAGLLAAQILGGRYPEIAERVKSYRADQTESVLNSAEAKGTSLGNLGADGVSLQS